MGKELTVWWDEEGDVLEISIGGKRKGFFTPIKDDVLLRVDNKSKKPIGLLFLNFSKNFKGARKLKLPIEIELKKKNF